jgi:hypothetical protein
MVHVKRAVGYVQITLGIMLIFASFVASDVLTAQLAKQNAVTLESYFEYAQLVNVTVTREKYIDHLYTLAVVANNTRFIIQTITVLVAVLAIMMVLQGVANTRLGRGDDIPPEELGRFITTVFIILYVIAAVYILFFKSIPGERWFDALCFLAILLAFLGIIRLTHHVVKKIEGRKSTKK